MEKLDSWYPALALVLFLRALVEGQRNLFGAGLLVGADLDEEVGAAGGDFGRNEGHGNVGF